SANRLVVSDFAGAGNPNATITASKISGMAGAANNVDINYLASGNFGGGILVRGSDTGDDTFNVQSTLAASPTRVEGEGGNDTFNVSSDAAGTAGNLTSNGSLTGIAAPLTIDAGAGSANRLVVSNLAGSDKT